MRPEDKIENYDEQIHALTENEVKEIHRICEDVGPRGCGSANEKTAQEYILSTLKDFADESGREEYSVHPDAFMGFVKVGGALMAGASYLNNKGASLQKKEAKKYGAGAAALTAATLAESFLEFGKYKQFLDPLYPEKKSGNVYAVRKSKGETKRRIILSGHTDSAPEWSYTYYLGSKGVTAVAVYGIAGLLCSMARTGLNLTSNNTSLKKKLKKLSYAFAPVFPMSQVFTNELKFVPGATDDLSGAYIAYSVMKFLSDNDIRFDNTEVVSLLVGGEEAGLRGSKAFFKAHPEYADDGVETIFVDFDTVRDEDFMMIYEKDMTGFVKNDRDVCELVQQSAREVGLGVPIGTIPLGSTDAAAASEAGIKAAAFVAMDPSPARYYHTRLDTADNLKPETIERVMKAAIRTVYNFDKYGAKMPKR